MQASKPKLPKFVSVGNLKFSIVQDDDALNEIAEELFKEPPSVRGATQLAKQLITLRSTGTYGDDLLKQIFAHELAHCFFNDIDIDATEEFVDDMGKVLLRFIRENPKVVAYLAG